MRLPLVGGKMVSFELQTGMTEAAWEQFMTVLTALKPSHVTDEPAPAAEPDDD